MKKKYSLLLYNQGAKDKTNQATKMYEKRLFSWHYARTKNLVINYEIYKQCICPGASLIEKASSNKIVRQLVWDRLSGLQSLGIMLCVVPGNSKIVS